MADSEFITPDALIDAVGGTSEVARALSVAPPVVSNWRSRGKIPAEMWSEIVALAETRNVNGITLDVLAAMHARRPADTDPAEARP